MCVVLHMRNLIINCLARFDVTGVTIYYNLLDCNTLEKAQNFKETYLLQDMDYLQIQSYSASPKKDRTSAKT